MWANGVYPFLFLFPEIHLSLHMHVCRCVYMYTCAVFTVGETTITLTLSEKQMWVACVGSVHVQLVYLTLMLLLTFSQLRSRHHHLCPADVLLRIHVTDGQRKETLVCEDARLFRHTG